MYKLSICYDMFVFLWIDMVLKNVENKHCNVSQKLGPVVFLM